MYRFFSQQSSFYHFSAQVKCIFTLAIKSQKSPNSLMETFRAWIIHFSYIIVPQMSKFQLHFHVVSLDSSPYASMHSLGLNRQCILCFSTCSCCLHLFLLRILYALATFACVLLDSRMTLSLQLASLHYEAVILHFFCLF